MSRLIHGNVTARPHPAWRCAVWLASVALGGMAGEAVAHGFGQRYDLPLPLLLFIGTGGVMVAASFAQKNQLWLCA